LKLDHTDLTGGMKIYSTPLLNRMQISAVRSEGYCFQIEMILAADACNATFEEVPITFVERVQGVSKMNNRIVVEALGRVTLWALRTRVRPNADKLYYVK
jgi:dolichol-phosphate mannosyltransferase